MTDERDMRMEFRAVNEGSVQIACSADDCRDLTTYLEGARDSDFDMRTYAAVDPEAIERALEELRAGPTDGQINLSAGAVGTIYAILGTIPDLRAFKATIDLDRFGALQEDVDGIFASTFPDAVGGPY